MNAQQFLAEFGHIASAPGGVARLRELVLQLAISGRLVERVSTDAPVDDSLDRAAMQRTVYESELELRATRLHSPLTTSPFAIPAHWRWVRLEQLALYLQRGKGPKYAERGAVSVVSQKCIQWADFDISQARHIADESVVAYGKERFLCPGDLLWNSTGTGTAGRVAMFQEEPEVRAVADSHVTVIRLANSEPKYFWSVIASPWVQARIHPTHPESLVSGTTQQVELATSTARALAVPCPPVEEQARIVAKVDELMALCDQLEKQQQARRKLQNALRQSTLHALASAESPHELQESWQRLEANFGRLFSEPEDVRDFKALVLDLAVSGRLLPTPAAPSLATDLIDQIGEARKRWMATAQDQEKKEAVAVQKKLQTQIVATPSSALPAHWCWASLLQISQVVVDCDHKTPVYSTNGIHLVRTTDIRDGEMLLHATKKVSEEAYLQRSRRLTPKPGDIFFTREAPMGEAAIVPEGQRVALGQRLMLIRLFGELVNPRFLIYVMQSPSFKGRLVESAVGMTVKHINVSDVETLQIPLPPKVEQDRIVQLLDDVLGRVGQLAAQLARGRKTAESLAISAVEALTGISVEQTEVAVVKAPPTELIAPLRLGTLPDVKDQAPLATLLARHQGEMSARDLWQRFGGEIDAFYAQLKTEVAHGWITEPPVAEVRAKPVETAEA